MVTHPNRSRIKQPRLPYETIYPDLERGGELPSAIIDQMRTWCAAGTVIWSPPRPRQNPAEVLAVIGGLWYAAQARLDVRWDGTYLRGDNPLRHLSSTHTSRAGKGGLHVSGEFTVALRQARADLWAGQVTLARIWGDCASAAMPEDWEHRAVCSITGYDPSSYLHPRDLGWSTNLQGFDVKCRPAVEIMAVLGAEGVLRAQTWRREYGSLLLPDISGVPLRDWRDARRCLRCARREVDWRSVFQFAGLQRPLLRNAAVIRMGRSARLGWLTA